MKIAKLKIENFAAMVFLSFLFAASTHAWTEPSQSPPNGNVLPPLRGSSLSNLLLPYYNSSLGSMVNSTLSSDGQSSTANGNFFVTGFLQTSTFKMTGGSAGAGKVLTSDADGDATWTTPAVVTESDPTVLASVKDGVSWSEIGSMPADFSNGDVSWSEVSGIPAGFSDGVDNTGGAPDWDDITGIPAGFADDTDNIGDTWAGLTGVPAGFADGVDDTGGAPDWDDITGIPAGFADGTDANSGGDITGVTAGTNLTGGGTSGAVTLSLVGNPLTVTRISIDTTQSNGGVSVTKMASASGLSKYGVYSSVSQAGNNYGVFGFASNGESNYGVYGRGDGTGAWGIYCYALSGYCGGNRVWTNNSDARLKKNIETIANGLDKVMGLRGVTYEWREGDGKKNVGFIAQEVMKVVPEVVGQDNEGYYTMNESSVTAVLVEAVKELKTENDELRERIEALEKKIK